MMINVRKVTYFYARRGILCIQKKVAFWGRKGGPRIQNIQKSGS